MKNQEENIAKEKEEFDELMKLITRVIFKWIGIVVCVLSICSIFISTEWILSGILEIEKDFGQVDSDAGVLLKKIGYLIAEFMLWLKNLPIYVKISGIIFGGIIWLSNNDD